MACPICATRPPKRFCPAKGEKICAVCCGREREVTIDCLDDCPYLIAAHRYEAEHRKPVTEAEFPYRDIQISPDFVYEHWPLITGLAGVILRASSRERDVNDSVAIMALEALAEAYRTLASGIYYERPPDYPAARLLYTEMGGFVQEFRKSEANRAARPSSLKDSEVFLFLVFLLRIAKQETNGRSRSRAFLSFLRSRFPMPKDAVEETPRIIVP